MFAPTAAEVNFDEWGYCHTLCTKRGWIKRRVDKITLLNDDTTRVHSTFDINVAKLINITKKYLAPDQRLRRVPIPIMLRAPEPILNIDVKLNDVSQSVAGRSASARYAQCAILHQVQQTIDLSAREDFTLFSKHLFEWMRTGSPDIVDSALIDARKTEKQINDGVISYDDLVRNPVTLNNLTYGWLWADILEDSTARELIKRYSSAHLVVVYIDAIKEGANAILKVTQDIPTKKPTNGLMFGLTGASYQIPNVPLGSNSEGRYHLKIESPDEFKVSALKIAYRGTKDRPWHRPQKINLGKETRVVSTRNLLEIHDGKDRDSDISKDLTVRFEPSIEVFTARALALVALLIGYFFLVTETTFEAKEIAAIAMAIGAISVTMPVLFRSHGESLFVAQMLQFSRSLLGGIIGIVLLTGVAHSTSRIPDHFTAPVFSTVSCILGGYFVFLLLSALMSHCRTAKFKRILREHEKTNRGI